MPPLSPTGPVTLERSGTTGLIVIDNPPVNAGSAAVRQGLVAAIAALDADETLTAGMLIGAGRTFISGSDIREFGKTLTPPLVPDVIAAIEASPKPIVAAISGAALGGGYEIALACDARIALRDAVVGLPEVQLGLIPGAGGTQRLPRLVGLPHAIELVCSGRRVAAPEALQLGMIDAIVEDLRIHGAAFAAQLPGKNRLRDRRTLDPDMDAVAAAKATAQQRARGLQSVEHALLALDLSLHASIDEALVQERRIFDEIRTGEEASALRHLFFAGRDAAKFGAGVAPGSPLALVGVVGAGTMGSGIAVACLQAGCGVVLVDADAAALDRARQFVQRERRGDGEATIGFVAKLEELATCDLIIEAIVEDMTAKSDLLKRVAAIAPNALLASNTSYLDLNELARATGRQGEVVGLHFFNPAHRMKLLEIVRGAASTPKTLATAMAFGRKLGKTSVISGVGEGFIGNRIYNAYRRHCEFLVADGAAPEQVDKVLREFGFAMGPFAVSDMSGLDIAWRMRQRLAATRDPRERSYALPDLLCAQGRFGRKTGAGWYVYDSSSPGGRSDPHVAEMIVRHAAESGVARREISRDEILARALGAIINEAGLVLEDGIARGAGDIDLVMVNGYGFPASKGGPLFWAGRQQRGAIESLIDAVEAAQGFGFRRSSFPQSQDP
jgi:3-hydroxyacyl-CoA dehydrogenase